MHISFILQQYVCYTTILNMFRAPRCSSSGGQIVSPQPLVSSPSVNSHTVCRWRADCSPLYYLACTCYLTTQREWHTLKSILLHSGRTSSPFTTANNVCYFCAR